MSLTEEEVVRAIRSLIATAGRRIKCGRVHIIRMSSLQCLFVSGDPQAEVSGVNTEAVFVDRIIVPFDFFIDAVKSFFE